MDQIAWGIVGTGHAATQFTQGLSLLSDARIQAVSSRDFSKAQRFTSVYKSSQAYPSYEELLADPAVDIVYIGTPHPLHHQHCLQALEAGKHVLCEKPFTMTAQEAREVVATAKARGLFCMEAMWMRFIPLVREAIQKVRDGAIGSVCMLSASLGHPIRARDDHRLLNPELGGGVLMDLGVYPLSLAQQILGKPEDLEGLLSLGHTGVDQQATTTLRYHSGALASISCSFQTLMSNDCLIMGTEGCLHIHAPLYRPIQLSLTSHQPIDMEEPASLRPLPWTKRVPLIAKTTHFLREKLLPFLRNKKSSYTRIYEGNGYQYEAIEAMRCIRAGQIESDLMPHNESIAVMETLDAIRAKTKEKL